MTHPELKAALIETIRHAKSLEGWADAVLDAFTPTREQVLRWDGLPLLLAEYGLGKEMPLTFISGQLSALTTEPSPQTYPLKTAVGPVLTEEMAVRVCNRLHEMGKKWQASGRSYRDTTNWDSRREETCYSINEGEFSNLAYYQCLNGYTLITPEEFLGVEAEASVKPVILQCQDGPCYDKNHLVHWISNYETGALDTYYAWAYIEEGCKEPCFLTQSACQAYLDSLLIGYECPEDLYGGDVRKGDLYTLTINSASCLPKGKSFWVYAMPYEIVKCWKKVYRKPSPEQPNG